MLRLAGHSFLIHDSLFFLVWLGSDAQALATILAVYAQRHGGPSQLAADRLVALLTAPTDSVTGTLPCVFIFHVG